MAAGAGCGAGLGRLRAGAVLVGEPVAAAPALGAQTQLPFGPAWQSQPEAARVGTGNNNRLAER